MAELITTPEEEAAYSFLDWDDEALGKMIKTTAITIDENEESLGRHAITLGSAALLIISAAIEVNATETDIKMEGVTMDGGKTKIGDWIVRVQKMPTNDSLED